MEDFSPTEVGLIVGLMLIAGIILLVCSFYCVFRRRFPIPGYKYFQLPTNNRHTNGHCIKSLTASAFRNNKSGMNGTVASSTRVAVEDLSSHIKHLYADSQINLSKEYENIAMTVRSTSESHVLSTNDAMREENKPRNRYVNVLPYDHSRVKLKTLWTTPPAEDDDKNNLAKVGSVKSIVESVEDPEERTTCCSPALSTGGTQKAVVALSDYINASFIDGSHSPAAYILTQAPMTNTLSDFWCMIWDYDVHVLVMLTNLEENGRKKSEQYWPTSKEVQIVYGPFVVTFVNEVVTAYYTVRTFTLAKKSEENPDKKEELLREPPRQILQYMYNEWPDHGRPDITVPLLRFIIKSSRSFEDDGMGPPVIHCSAGVGRSGCYIALHSLMLEVDRMNSADIFGYLVKARKQRMALCQNEAQYAFIYDALHEYVQSGHTEVYVATFDEYFEGLLKNDEFGLRQQHIFICDANTSKNVTCQCPVSFETALQPCNKAKNRSEKIVPPDHGTHRVLLVPKPGVSGSGYINACFIPSYFSLKQFIVTQRPLEETVTSFWQMIWEFRVKTIILVVQSESDDNTFIPSMESPLAGEKFSVEQVQIPDSGSYEAVSTSSDSPWQHRTLHCRLLRSSISETTSVGDSESPLLCQIVPVRLPEPGADEKEWTLLVDKVQKLMPPVEETRRTFMKSYVVVMDEFGGGPAGLVCGLQYIRQQALNEGSVDLYQVARVYDHIRPGIFGDLSTYRLFHEAARSVCHSAAEQDAITSLFLAPGGTLQISPPNMVSKRLSAILEEELTITA